MNNKVKRELEKIEIPDELHQRSKMGVKQAKEEMGELNQLAEKPSKAKKKWKLRKKVAYISAAIAVLIGLFIGSIFVSPTMANVAAKIPFLSSVFETDKPITMIIFEELKNEGYQIKGPSFNVKSKTVTIAIGGSGEYYHDVKNEVKDLAQDILLSEGYNAYTLEVVKHKKPYPNLSEEARERNRKLDEKSNVLSKAIENGLKETDYYRQLQIGFTYVKSEPYIKFISIGIPNTYSQTQIGEVKELIKQAASKVDMGELPIKVNKINTKSNALEERWMPVINTVTEGLLAKKEYKVTKVGYDLNPLMITITTSIQSSNPQAKKLGEKIEQTIINFIESDQVAEKVQNDEYEIEVLSKDKKKIN